MEQESVEMGSAKIIVVGYDLRDISIERLKEAVKTIGDGFGFGDISIQEAANIIANGSKDKDISIEEDEDCELQCSLEFASGEKISAALLSSTLDFRVVDTNNSGMVMLQDEEDVYFCFSPKYYGWHPKGTTLLQLCDYSVSEEEESDSSVETEGRFQHLRWRRRDGIWRPFAFIENVYIELKTEDEESDSSVETESEDEESDSSVETESEDEEKNSSEESGSDACDHKSPQPLTQIAFKVMSIGKNNVLHRLVLANPHPGDCARDNYLSAILRSFSACLSINCFDENGLPALHLAIVRGNYYMVKKMLSSIVQLDVNAKTRDGMSALRLALDLGHREISQTLLCKGANINEVIKNENRLIHEVVKVGNSEMLQLLLENECELNIGNIVGYTPLHLCVSLGVCELLISSGANVNAHSSDGHSPLHNAVCIENFEVIRSLCEHGCEIDHKDNLSNTALHYAVRIGKKELVEILILYGANVNIEDRRRKTPLHHACEYANADVAEVLLRNKADVDALDEGNRTPLYLVVNSYFHFTWEREQKIIKLLLENGANVQSQDSSDISPLSLAQALGLEDILELLTQEKR